MSREVTVKLIPTSFETEGTYDRLTSENVENGYSDDDSEDFATFTVSDRIFRYARYIVDTSSIPEDAEIIDATGYAKVSVNSPNNFANGSATVGIVLDGTSFSLPSRMIENTSAEKLPLYLAYPGRSVSDMGYTRSDFNNLFIFFGGQKSAGGVPGDIYFYGASIEMTYLTDTPEPEPPTPEPPTPDMSKNVSVGPDMTDHSIMNALNIKYGLNLGSGGSIVDKLNAIIVQNGGEAHPAATIAELIKLLPESGGDPKEQAIDTIVSLLSWAINADITHSKELKEQAKSDLEGGFRSFLMVSDKEAVLQAAESLSTTESSLWGMGVEHMLSQAVSGNFITNDAAANIMSFFQTTPK